MNYIKRIEKELDEADDRIAFLEQQIVEVVNYLSLPKFSEETRISKYDILRMLGRY